MCGIVIEDKYKEYKYKYKEDKYKYEECGGEGRRKDDNKEPGGQRH